MISSDRDTAVRLRLVNEKLSSMNSTIIDIEAKLEKEEDLTHAHSDLATFKCVG